MPKKPPPLPVAPQPSGKSSMGGVVFAVLLVLASLLTYGQFSRMGAESINLHPFSFDP